MLNDNDDWSEAVSNIVETIYHDKLGEPKISQMLLPWDEKGDIDIIFIKIIRDFAGSEEEICYLAKNLVNLSDIETLFYKLLSQNNNYNYSTLASTLLRILEIKLTNEQIENLLFKIRDLHDKTGIPVEDAIDYLTVLQGENKFADIPCWVNIEEGENLSLLRIIMPGDGIEANKIRDIEFIEKAKDLFYEVEHEKVQGRGVGLSLDDAIQGVLASYSHANDKEGSNATRIFGPLNRIPGVNCSSNPYIPGPCRMLECVCFEGEDLDQDAEIDIKYKNWFIGKCQICLCQIRDCSHAVRYPLENGGWSGCYCSLECLKKDINYFDGKVNMRLNNMIFSLQDSGIMDRTRV